MNNKNRNDNYTIIVASFIIPITIIAIAYYMKGIYPHGPNTILTMDMGSQYMPFWASFRYLCKSDNSIFFNMSGALGNNFWGFAYYIFSPLSWITVLFPLEKLPDAIYFLTLLRIGLCGLGFSCFLLYAYKDKKHKLAILLISLCYALMSYNVGYSINLMWLDAVLMLPWILVGIEKILNDNGPGIFIFSFFFSLLCNYYISFMSAVFAVGYLFIRLYEVKKLNIKKVLSFISYALMAIGLVMPVLLPGYLALVNGKMDEEAKPIVNLFRYRFVDVIGQLFSGKYDTMLDDGLPLIFCGTGTILLVILYFMKSKDNFKIKAIWLLLIVYYVFAMCFIPLDRVMHGFMETTCFEARYSFTFSCLLLILAYRGADSVSEWFKSLSISKIVEVILFFFVIGELYFNCSIIIGGIMEELLYTSRLEYDMTLESKSELLDTIKDEDFYRVSDYMPYTYNDGAWLGYNGIGYFSSCYNRTVMDFLGSLGEDQSYHILQDGRRTPLEESLLGCKYRISYWDWDDIGELIATKGLYVLTKNVSSLSIGYMVDIENGDEFPLFGKNAFENQNIIAKELSGSKENVFEELEIIDFAETCSEEYAKITSFSVEPKTDATIWLYFEKADDRMYYNENKDTRLIINGIDYGEFIDNKSDSPFIIYIGRYSVGDHVNVETFSNVFYEDFHVAFMNEEAYQNIISELKQYQFNVIKHKGGHFYGSIETGEGGNMLLTLPYMNGWKIKVDGKLVDYTDYRDSLVMVNVGPGKHEIDVKYISPGFGIGLVIGILSITILMSLKHNCCFRRDEEFI